mmetsp:Transcript_4367/g.5797  ORF Transcript_4367/g.5797 Transcript_4367/m.5797 type:complete len:487 (+) Transcript_4367:157-1617(+)|eukprot:CAMPEP_0204841284 /NCGR_PEP_ID=MMETSP1346-20131115/41363_1 /ASSEMBLY_ACC=CAM_ASM_000771 /TAXON_ID=215587 /ORGANISM="Aplanochytrium stocchinoi, Strain GSBS06" /LENGTH=486 /DNA_ID=CAMNT_0051979313 /DNA_START=87 /DNA_END=1547 /DNA_ORIENTATION=+
MDDHLQVPVGIVGLEPAPPPLMQQDRIPSGDRPTHKFQYQGKVYDRKKRIPLSKENKLRLEEAFQRKEVPRGRQGTAAKIRLAKELDMDPKEVHKWFDNRRTKESMLEKRMFDSLNGLPPKKPMSARKKAKRDAAQKLAAQLLENDPGHIRRGRRRKHPLIVQEPQPPGIAPLLDRLTSYEEPPEEIVQEHFKQIGRYFDGAFDLKIEAVSQELQEAKEAAEEQGAITGPNAGNPNVGQTALMKAQEQAAKGGRKPRIVPTLANVLDVTFSKESCFHPLVQAVEVISAKGYLDALIRRVLHENSNLRTFFMWYLISKYSGDRISGAVFRCFLNGLSPAIGKLSLLDVLESQIPELLDGALTGSRTKYSIFSSDEKESSSHSDVKPLMEFLNKVFVGRKVSHKKKTIMSTQGPDGDLMITGNITKVLPPTQRSGGEPRFRIFYANLDIASTVQWQAVKQVMPEGTVAIAAAADAAARAGSTGNEIKS